MLFLYMLMTMSVGIIWVSFSPILATIEEVYNINAYLVSLIQALHLALFLPGTILAIINYNTRDLKYGLVLGLIMQTLGAGAKLLINIHFSFLLIGQSF
mmetsp:Transcript_20611/g.18252  ORF Transcript_20611/g.18252 Transcript_20611/m.18252 type:complete len:99 (-) Transcript_20611:891-1187(-)